MEEKYYKVSEVAKILKSTPQTIRNWIESGIISAVRPGRNFMVSKSEIDKLLKKK